MGYEDLHGQKLPTNEVKAAYDYLVVFCETSLQRLLEGLDDHAHPLRRDVEPDICADLSMLEAHETR